MVAVVFGGGGGGGCIGFSMVLRMRHSGTLQPRFPAWVERVFDAVRESRRLAPPHVTNAPNCGASSARTSQ